MEQFFMGLVLGRARLASAALIDYPRKFGSNTLRRELPKFAKYGLILVFA
jgi:hypothetical protein